MTTNNMNKMPAGWDEFWARIGNEEWLTAKVLLELCWPVRTDAARYLLIDGRWFEDGPWQAWAENVETTGRGWSSTEFRLYDIVIALTAGRPLKLSTLGYLGSWETHVWAALVEWGTGGNNRDHAGRAWVVTR